MHICLILMLSVDYQFNEIPSPYFPTSISSIFFSLLPTLVFFKSLSSLPLATAVAGHNNLRGAAASLNKPVRGRCITAGSSKPHHCWQQQAYEGATAAAVGSSHSCELLPNGSKMHQGQKVRVSVLSSSLDHLLQSGGNILH